MTPRFFHPFTVAAAFLALLTLALLAGRPVAAQDPLTTGAPSRLGAAQGLGDGALEPIDFLPVEQAYPLAVEAEGAGQLRLVWQMPAGYYLYQHAFKFSFTRDGDTLVLAPEYPEALIREDEFFGRVSVYYDSVDLTLAGPTALRSGELAVTSQGCADAGLCYPPRTQRFRIEATGAVTELRDAAVAGAMPAAAARSGLLQLVTMMLFAFVGGMILNLMPCVLPILSLKVVGFACSPDDERHRHGLLYSAGVIASFILVALLLFALRGAGQSIGWGFQLQSPGFVIALAYLFVVMGLGLSGAVELGNRFVNLGSGLAGRGGATGSFFTGVLAVVVASPCTAPFMGTALGFALVQPPVVGLGVFFALGAGMAAPMLLLSYSALARQLMPRPGPWMERLKQALAFPLYATALWLFWVFGRQTGVDSMTAALLGALLIALGIWLWRGGLLARTAAIAFVVLAVGLAGWRPGSAPGSGNALPEGSVAYSPAMLQQLRAQGRPVFVDVTADWCITCLANERSVLSAQSVQEAFEAAGVTYMVADWTDYDDSIAAFVASHGRSGIPLYVLYAEGRAPLLLPQLLRKQTVIDALAPLGGAQVAMEAAR